MGRIIESKEYSGFSLDKSIKFYVTYNEEQECFIADVFNPTVEKQDYGKAYIESFEFDSLEEAIEDLKHYKLGLTINELNNK